MNRLITFFIILLGVPLISVSQTFDLVWESKQIFKTPESVYFNAERNQIYVSNINGKPTVKDGNGFISLLSPDGKVRNLTWIKGMNAPKGMVVVDNLLYVTDIDRIHIIDINKDEIINTINVEGASFLNDMESDGQGNIFITDMQNNLLYLLKDNTVTEWLKGEKIVKPNGLAMHKGALCIGVENSILKVDLTDKSIKVFIDETGPVDGLVFVSGTKFVISDWSGRIMRVSPTEKVVLSNTTDKNIQAADLGFIPSSKIVLIPTFNDNRVEARKLP